MTDEKIRTSVIPATPGFTLVCAYPGTPGEDAVVIHEEPIIAWHVEEVRPNTSDASVSLSPMTSSGIEKIDDDQCIKAPSGFCTRPYSQDWRSLNDFRNAMQREFPLRAARQDCDQAAAQIGRDWPTPGEPDEPWQPAMVG